MKLSEVTLHGDRVVYREAGDPRSPAILLIHGITSSGATWDPVIPALAEHAHVIAPDLLGHGDSDKPMADYSLGGFATGLRDLLEHLGHERVTVVGHSLGGGIAMQFSYQYSDFCERLVLVDSGGLGREVTPVLRAATLPGAEYVLPVIASRHLHDAAVGSFRYFRWIPIRPRPSVVEAVRGYATLADSPTRKAFVHSLRSVVEPGGQRVSAMARLYLTEGLPTLIVWGAHDTFIPVRHAYAAHETIPGSRLEIFEQSRHFPHMDEPARFARTVLDFLATTQPAPVERQLIRDRMSSRHRESLEQR